MTGNGRLALRYAGAGWPVLPLHSPTPAGGCSCDDADCGSPAKHPRTLHGVHDASRRPRRVRDWWARWPAANVGLATGRPLVVIDVDGATGQHSLDELQVRHEVLPTTLTASTGSGEHRYFSSPGRLILNSAGRLGPGLDVRGEHGYVVAPPSIHHSGRRYRWTQLAQPQVLPAWLADLLAPAMPPRPTIPDAVSHPDRYFAAAVDGELHDVATALEGSRNDTLNRAAFRLGQLVGSGHGDVHAASEHLHAAAIAAGLGDREATATIRSGLHAGLQHPRAIAAQ